MRPHRCSGGELSSSGGRATCSREQSEGRLYEWRLSNPRLTTTRKVASYRTQNVGWIQGCLFDEAKFHSKSNDL